MGSVKPALPIAFNVQKKEKKSFLRCVFDRLCLHCVCRIGLTPQGFVGVIRDGLHKMVISVPGALIIILIIKRSDKAIIRRLLCT